MPFDMTPMKERPMTTIDRARHLRHIGKSWAVVAVALRPLCTRNERNDVLRRIHREETAA
jgi:hypothetical protein